jgi:putative DNA primase/helicase
MASEKSISSTLPVNELALQYADRGWSVEPMHTVTDGRCSCGSDQCDRKGKHPRTSHGVKDATTDVGQIKEWWERWPAANIGIAAGRKSRILVIDIDPRNGGDETLKKCVEELGELPATVTANTGGGGRHFFFRYPPFLVKKDSQGKRFGPGIDVLSKGSIVIVPPSRHASGNRYAWQDGKSAFEIKLAELPPRWLDRLSDEPESDAAAANDTTLITPGQRNNHLTTLAGAMRCESASNFDPTSICSQVFGTVSEFAIFTEPDRRPSVTPPASLKPIVDQSLGLMSSGVTVRRRFTA